MYKKGQIVRFTHDNLGALFSDAVFNQGDLGHYWGPHPEIEDWHLINAEASDEVVQVPVHGTQFEPAQVYTMTDLKWKSRGNDWERAVLELKNGDSGPNPASTKSQIYGPAKVIYDKAPDGGFNVTVE